MQICFGRKEEIGTANLSDEFWFSHHRACVSKSNVSSRVANKRRAEHQQVP
jgi:hypothetical protein